MPTKRTEFLTYVKAVMEESTKKDLRNEVIGLFQDLPIDIDETTLKEAAKHISTALNAVLAQAGKQTIDLQKMIKMPAADMWREFGRIAATEYMAGWNTVKSKMGTPSVDFSGQIKALEKARDDLRKQQAETEKSLKELTKFQNQYGGITIKYGVQKFKDGEDIDAMGDELLDKFYDAKDALDAALDEDAYDDPEKFIPILRNFLEIISQIKTLAKSAKSIGHEFNETLKDFFALDIDGEVMTAIADFDDEDNEIAVILRKYVDSQKKRIQEINVGVKKVEEDLAELYSQAGNTDVPSKIAQARDRVNKQRKDLRSKTIQNIQATVDENYDPGNAQLKGLHDKYKASVEANEDWEVQAQHLVKFVKAYEKYKNTTFELRSTRQHQKETLAKYASDYEEAAQHLTEAQSDLRQLAEAINQPAAPAGKAGVAIAQNGAIDSTAKQQANVEAAEAKVKAAEEEARLAKEKAEAERKAKEAAVKQAQAAEAARIKAEEEARLAKEKAEAERKAAISQGASAASQERYKAYRSVQPPEGSGKNKSGALEDWGAEYWSTGLDIAKSYAEDNLQKGHIIVGEINPKKPLIIDAGGALWNQFDKMPDLVKMFPGLADLMKKKDYVDDDGQKYINEKAREMGYDSVIIKNVQDALNTSNQAETQLSTTIAVLDESIVTLTGAIKQLDIYPDSKFDESIEPIVPSYYDIGKQKLSDGVTPTPIKQQIATEQEQAKGVNKGQIVALIEDAEAALKDAKALRKLAETQADALDAKLQAATTQGVDAAPQKQSVADVGALTALKYNSSYKTDEEARAQLKKDFSALWKQTQEYKKELQSGYDTIETESGDIWDAADLVEYSETSLRELVSAYAMLGGAVDDFKQKNQQAFAAPIFEQYKQELDEYLSKLEDGAKEVAAKQTGTTTDLSAGVKVQDDQDDEDIQRENGLLEDKLELLRDIADQYGVNITQRHRSIYDDLGDFSSDTVVEKVEAADEALEELGSTYDKIILKLANGKKVEILPDDKGLRSLYKFADEYGETYDGIEIDDVEFIRKAKEETVRLDQQQIAAQQEQARLAEEARIKAEEEARLAREQAEAEARAAAAREERWIHAVAARQEAEMQAQLAAEAEAKAQEELRLAQQQADVERRVSEELAKQVAAAQPGGGKVSGGSAVDESKLKNILSSITYNVKVTTDASDSNVDRVVIDEASLEGVLSRVLSSIKPRDHGKEPWALDYTLLVVKGILDQIKIDTGKIGNTGAQPAAITDVGNVLATEKTLSDVLAAIKAIKTSGGGSTRGRAAAPKEKSDLPSAGPAPFTEKLKSRLGDLVKFRTQLAATDRLADDVRQNIDALWQSLQQVENSADLSVWNEQFKQLKTKVGIDKIVGDVSEGEDNKKYQELIALTRLQNDLEIKHAKAKDGSAEQAYYAEWLQHLRDIISAQEIVVKNDEYEMELAKMREKHERDIGVIRAKNADQQTNKSFKDEVKKSQQDARMTKTKSVIYKADEVRRGAQSIEGLTEQDRDALKAYKSQIEDLQRLYDRLNEKDYIVTPEDQDLLKLHTAELNQLTKEYQELISQSERLSGDNAKDTGYTFVGDTTDLEAYEQQLTKAVIASTDGKAKIKGFDAATKTLTYTVKTGKNQFTEYTAEVKKAGGAIVALQGKTKQTETFWQASMRKLKEISSYFSAMSVFSRLGQELRRGIQYVREIDLALTELRKVTDETEETYDEFLETAAKTGAKLGTTISAVTDATATFAKLGYSMKQATEMAEAAIVYKNVGDNIESTGDAADSIISTMKGFRLEASESMAIVDRFNEVGNRFAITSRGIGEALRLSASALSEGGNSLDESIGLITAANEVVNDPSSVGTALKTLTLRLRGSKTELEEMGEDVSDMATTTSQLQAKLLALTGGQVDIMLDANTFKNSTQILREMADAWEDMTDIQRASALELMGGKRQANVLSALIQNFDTVEKVIETSANSAGSALEENERYLDSIQGKIDQFNNAMQAMWSNTLDSDVVKGFVAIGTEIIKIVDKIGLLNSALLAFGAYKGVSHIFKSFKNAGVTIQSVLRYVNSLTVGFKENAVAQTAANGATLASNVANKLFRTELVETLATQYLTTQSTQALEKAKYALKLAEMGLLNGVATTKDVQAAQAAVEAASIPVDITKIGTTELMGLAFKQLALSIWSATKAVLAFLFTNPIGWIILAVTAIVGAIAAWNEWGNTAENLREKLSDLKSEISDIKSELDSLNSELETTNERMAELLAKDSLTFTEQEELDALQKQNDELEREIYLLEQREKRLQKQAQDTFDDLMEKETKEKDRDGDGSEEIYDKSLERKIDKYEKWVQEYEDAKQALVKAEKSGDEREIEKAEKRVEKAEKKVEKWQGKVDKELDQYFEDAEGIDYASADEETRKYLDYIYNTEGRLNILNGEDQAKTVEIKRIFNKDDMSGASDEIDKLVEKLAKNPDDKNIIAQIGEQCKLAEKDLKAVGLSVQDATDYFTKLGVSTSFDTIDGKIAEISKAATDFENLLGGKKFAVDGVNIGLADLFDQEGKIIQTKLSQVFQSTSEQTRDDITRILEGSYEQIKDGTADTERLLTGFGLKAAQQVLKIQNKVLGEQNLELFPNLKDEIDGIIDKFSEFSAAVGSVVDAMDTLEQARAEEAYSGSISIETLENLMKYTDDYAQLIEIDETGAIRLAADAESILIEQRLQKIKTDAAAAVQTAQANLQQAEYNAKAINETGPVQQALTSATDALAGSWAYLGSLIGDVTSGNFGGMFDRASAAYSSTTSNRETARAEVVVSVEDAQEALNKALDQQKIADALTSDNVKAKYSSSEASGDTDNPEDAAQKKREEDWDNLLKKYQRELDAIAHEKDLIQAEIDEAEARGNIASEEYYERLIELEQEDIAQLEAKADALKDFYAQYSASMSADEIDDWNAEMRETALAIKEAEINMIEFGNTMREIGDEYFSKISEDIDAINEEIEFMHGLLEDEPVADENGNWSNEALTRLGLYTQQMEKAAFETQRAKDALAELQQNTSEADKNTDWYREKEEELTQAIYDGVEAYGDYKDGIIELNEARVEAIKEGIEKEIDAYNDLIENKKEALDAERDLFDFKKNIEEQNKSIADTERKLAALSGSTAAEDIAERKRLEAELRKQQGSLDDTYYDHSMTAQQNALDEEGRYFEEAQQRRIESLEAMLENTEELITNSMMDVMLNADTVLATIDSTALQYGISLSTNLKQPWIDASAQAIAWREELKKDMTEGEWAAMIGKGGAITAFSNGVATKLGGSWDAVRNKAKTYADFLTGNELKKSFSGAITTFTTQLQAIVDKWNAIRKAASDAVAITPTAPTSSYTGGGGSGGNAGGNPGPAQSPAPAPKVTPKAKTMHADGQLYARTTVPTSLTSIHKTVGGVTYVPIPGTDHYVKKSDAPFGSAPYGTKKYKFYAQGTMGTSKDGWAVTDESWIGEEITLAAGKNGQLQYLKKGSSVLPADISARLMELAQMPTSNFGSNIIKAIAPNVQTTNQAVNINFEALVKADNITNEVLPEVSKMVERQLDAFSKKLNYSLKLVGGR